MGDAARRKRLGLTKREKHTPVFAGTVWHYTIGVSIPNIIASGVLMQSGAGQLNRIIPVVWFSKNQVWEGTAAKKHPDNPEISLSREDTARFYNGVYRIGASLLKTPMLRWKDSAEVLKFTPNGIKKMDAGGLEMNADPYDWYASVDPVYRKEWTAVQVLENGQWVDFKIDESAADVTIVL